MVREVLCTAGYGNDTCAIGQSYADNSILTLLSDVCLWRDLLGIHPHMHSSGGNFGVESTLSPQSPPQITTIFYLFFLLRGQVLPLTTGVSMHHERHI
ncbi:uncharacterized protein LACBIDRAFT_308548 [Laccaria bicolor S238N-H82]|uniref:Predicted protein n=1 Tax=Laccaria bicolor (strain S238N-H82 / ATCC MYA-4686) TaxID=486041 RepID=B0CWM3_LACBS|nr:uncharacterized protein LACBIDRAFT_308548 [Laccaria bicolor S238N-H82]EDR13093.1 predicted protein [Laccaria bicolor S238N-H82]|eukprot:XP_001875591.1 predicted protein [Laccaria bicolor S238N-H82]